MLKEFSNAKSREDLCTLGYHKYPFSAQFNDTYFPAVDGVVRTMHSYAARMNRIAKCVVVVPKVKKDYRDEFVYPVLRAKSVPFVQGYSAPAPSFSRKMTKELMSQGLDIYHAHSPFMMGHYARRISKKLGIPMVATFHSKYYDDFMTVTGSKIISEQLVEYIVRFYNSADAVWTVSRGTAETLRSYGYKGGITVM